MLKVSGTTITMTRGDTAVLDVSLTDVTGAAYEMQAGDTLTITVRKTASESSDVLLTATSDNTSLCIRPQDTAGIQPGACSYDIQLNTAQGDVFTVIGAESSNAALRNFVLLPEVTI